MFCLRSSFKSIVVLLFCLPLLLASGQDSKTGDQDLSGVWDQFTGEWVRYADDWILTKNITRGQEVFTRQNQYGTPDFVGPVVVVGKPPQGSLQPAYDDGNPGEGLPGKVRVHQNSAVWTPSDGASWGINVLLPAVPGRRKMVDHGIDVS